MRGRKPADQRCEERTRKALCCYHEGLNELLCSARDLLPYVDLNQVIRSFAAVRPNPYMENGESLHDFCIENPAPGFYSLIGIKTPGLTCANELGLHLASKAAQYLRACANAAFDPHRPAIRRKDSPEFYDIICQCGTVTRGEILEAIRRGATTVDGVKHRVGSGMGRCQGSRCTWEIVKILKETGANPEPLF